MKYISICSGIEAASVAWEGFGWTPLAFSEIEAFPSTLLAHHYPGVPNLGDMTKFDDWPEEILAQCDILVGGPPCQAFSVAGLRKSLQDERGNVTLAYVRLLNHIDEVRRRHGRPPVVAVYENVPGLLSTKDNAFGCLIGALCGCDEAPETQTGKWPKSGFLCGEARRVGYRVLDAQFFGVAQRRRRIFLIAVPCELVDRFGERACPSKILSLRESMRGNPPTRGKAWQGVARSTAASLTSSGVERCGESRGQDDVVLEFGGNRSSGPLDVATPCLANSSPHGRQDFASETFVTCFHPTQDPISSEDGSTHALGTGSSGGCATAAVAFTKSKRAQSVTDDESWVPGEVTPTMSCFDQGDTRATTVVAFNTWGGEPRSDRPNGGFYVEENADTSKTLDSQGGLNPSASQGGTVVVAVKPGQSEAAGGTFVTEEFTPTIQSQNNGSTAVPAVAFSHSAAAHSYGVAHVVEGSPPLRGGGAGNSMPAVATAMAVRRLTPRECERLQGFPDDYTLVTYRNKPAADGPRYKALGNSMAVPCMWWIGMRIKKATEQE